MADIVKVAINGYGTIGKRVADAVLKQDDMEIIGVTKLTPDYKAREVIKKNIPLYSINEPDIFEKAGYPVEGTLEDLLGKVDVVIDCSPKRKGEENIEIYRKFNLKAIFQGGEKHNLVQRYGGSSFVAQCNYNDSWGKDYCRVVSCNSTGGARVLKALDDKFGIKKARVCFLRRSSDPEDTSKIPLNSYVPTAESPTHHGPDIQTVFPVEIITLAGLLPMTLMHAHMYFIELKSNPKKEDVIHLFNETSRIRLVSINDGIKSTAHIKDISPDIYEICVWEECIGVQDTELTMQVAIDQRADVIPENIDAIRAMFMLMPKEESIAKTNKSLGVK